MKLKKTITIDEELYNKIIESFNSKNFSDCINNICSTYFKNEIEKNKKNILNINNELLNKIIINQEIILNMLNTAALEKEGIVYFGDRKNKSSEAYLRSVILEEKKKVDNTINSGYDKLFNGEF